MAAISENEDVGGRFVLGSSVEVYEDIRAVFISSDIESVGIGLARIIEGIEVCHRACRQHSLELRSELIEAHGQNRKKSLFLTEGESVHGYLGACQLHGDFAL